MRARADAALPSGCVGRHICRKRGSAGRSRDRNIYLSTDGAEKRVMLSWAGAAVGRRYRTTATQRQVIGWQPATSARIHASVRLTTIIMTLCHFHKRSQQTDWKKISITGAYSIRQDSDTRRYEQFKRLLLNTFLFGG